MAWPLYMCAQKHVHVFCPRYPPLSWLKDMHQHSKNRGDRGLCLNLHVRGFRKKGFCFGKKFGKIRGVSLNENLS